MIHDGEWVAGRWWVSGYEGPAGQAGEEQEVGWRRQSRLAQRPVILCFFSPPRQDYTSMTCELAALTHRSLSTRRGE